jgi:hypothetical protein
MDEQQKQLQAWLVEQARLKRRGRMKKEIDTDGGVSINSLMDAVTIILIFLLMNFSTNPMKITPSKDLELPLSTTELGITEKTVTITVSTKEILVDDTKVMSIKNNVVESADPTSLSIDLLKSKLEDVVKRRKEEIAKIKGSKPFKDVITIIAHGNTHYRLVNKVIYTAGIAGFTKFKFAVIKGAKFQQVM